MPNVPYPYEVICKLVTGNGSVTPICSLSPSLSVQGKYVEEWLNNCSNIGLRQTSSLQTVWSVNDGAARDLLETLLETCRQPTATGIW